MQSIIGITLLFMLHCALSDLLSRILLFFIHRPKLDPIDGRNVSRHVMYHTPHSRL